MSQEDGMLAHFSSVLSRTLACQKRSWPRPWKGWVWTKGMGKGPSSPSCRASCRTYCPRMCCTRHWRKSQKRFVNFCLCFSSLLLIVSTPMGYFVYLETVKTEQFKCTRSSVFFFSFISLGGRVREELCLQENKATLLRIFEVEGEFLQLY